MLATIALADAQGPTRLRERLGHAAPCELSTLGNMALLVLPKTALFCSARCPGSAILRAYDQAAQWRDAGRCIISGFHSPVQQECLHILLRGTPPVIICPARTLPKHIPAEWQRPLDAGRLLILTDLPHGIVARCCLEHHEVHMFDCAVGLVTHYKRHEELPPSLEHARSIALHPTYVFVEVHPSWMSIVRDTGEVTVIPA